MEEQKQSRIKRIASEYEKVSGRKEVPRVNQIIYGRDMSNIVGFTAGIGTEFITNIHSTVVEALEELEEIVCG